MAAGFGVAAVSGTIVACLLLGYGMQPPPCDRPMPGPGVSIDGCFTTRLAFGDWITQPLVIAGFAFALGLLVIAGETVRRGFRQRARA